VNNVGWRISHIDLVGFRYLARGASLEGFIWLVDQVPDNSIVLELPDSIDKVLPHEVLGERKRRDRRFVNDFETRDIAHRTLHTLKDAWHIYATAIVGESQFEIRNVASEVLF
jgi:hypothetical protein